MNKDGLYYALVTEIGLIGEKSRIGDGITWVAAGVAGSIPIRSPGDVFFA